MASLKERFAKAWDALQTGAGEYDLYDPSYLPNQQMAGQGLANMISAAGELSPDPVEIPMKDGRESINLDPSSFGAMGTVKAVGKLAKASRAAKKAAEAVESLPMDKASRMARAKEMGFDTDKVYYHGTKADIDSFDPAALGVSTNAGSARQGFFFASDASTAGDYATLSPERSVLRGKADAKKAHDEWSKFHDSMLQKYGPTKMNFGAGPVEDWTSKATKEELETHSRLLKESNEKIDLAYNPPERQNNSAKTRLESELERMGYPPELRATAIEQAMRYGESADHIPDSLRELAGRAKNNLGDPEEGANVIKSHLRMQNPFVHDFQGKSYRDVTYNDLMEKAKAGGHDSIVFKNTYDPANMDNKVLQDIVAVFDPSQIRSVNAAFDPAKKKSSDILAGIGGAALVGGAMASGSDAQAAPMKGETAWINRGMQRLGISDQNLASNPKARQLLIEASDLPEGSKRLQAIKNQLRGNQ